MSASSPSQGMTPVAPNYPPIVLAKSTYPGEESCDKPYEPEFVERFSKSLLRMRLQEFHGGKYTRRYIEAYLEFMVLSGMISNLDYLDFTAQIREG